MSREAHVRFCEGPQVKFLRSTHPYIPMRRGSEPEHSRYRSTSHTTSLVLEKLLRF